MIHLLERWRRRWGNRSEWLRLILKRSASKGTESVPGILLIQIDGLALRQLESAVAEGRMPFVRTLIECEHHMLSRFYSGLPTSTPAVQGELFYGVSCAVPAWGFLDREMNYLGSMYEARLAKKVQKELEQKGGRPLLQGGSSWSNMYTGGADPRESHFVGSCLNIRDMMRSISLTGVLLGMVLYFPAVLRFITLFVWEFVASIEGLIQGVRRGEPFRSELGLVVSRLLVGTGLGELITIGAALDLARGLPIIHLNYLGYDEFAHHRGPGSPMAHRALRRIDRRIRQLYRRAKASQRRDYQVWIYADHGQETVRAYVDAYQTTLGRVVLEGLRNFQKIGGRGFRALPDAPERYASWIPLEVRERMQQHERADDAPEEEQAAFAIAARGPVGHVYLALPLAVEEKRLFARWLVNDGRIPGVLLSVTQGKALWVHAKGEAMFPEDGPSFCPHCEALRPMLSQDIVTWCEHRNSGDLILLGWDPQRDPFTFPHERGSHAGPGLEETGAFALLPPHARIPEEAADFLRPATLRAAVLHALGREKISRPNGPALSEPIPTVRICR